VPKVFVKGTAPHTKRAEQRVAAHQACVTHTISPPPAPAEQRVAAHQACVTHTISLPARALSSGWRRISPRGLVSHPYITILNAQDMHRPLAIPRGAAGEGEHHAYRGWEAANQQLMLGAGPGISFEGCDHAKQAELRKWHSDAKDFPALWRLLPELN
jgi:hypothetical protein